MLEISLQLLLKEFISQTKVRDKLNGNEKNQMISMDIMVREHKQKAMVQKIVDDICGCAQVKIVKISMNKTLILLNENVLLESINQISIISSYESGSMTNKENMDSNNMVNSKRTNKNKSKMVNLECLSRLCMYCQQNGIDFKGVIKMLLIKQINQASKMIIYRTQEEIVQFIQNILYYMAQRQQSSMLISLSEENGQQSNEQTIKANERAVQQFMNKLKYQKQENNYDKVTYFFNNSKVKSKESANILNLLKKSIGQNQMRRLFDLYYDQLINSGKISIEIRQSIKTSSFFKILGLYFTKINQKLVEQKHSISIQTYLYGFYQHRQFVTMNRYKNTRTINNYLISFCKHKSVKIQKHIKTAEQYLRCFIKSINFTQQYTDDRIITLQSNIRAFLSHSVVEKKLEDEYRKTNLLKYNENKKLYAKIVEDINRKLLHKNGHVSNGIVCHIFLVHIQNWANSQIFAPSELLNFINPILQTNVSIVKIWIENMELKIIRGDGKLFTYGLMNNNSKETHTNHKQYKNVIKSDDLTYQLMKDASDFLFAKGENNYGQLGIGQLVESTDNWKRVRIKEKVKIYDGRAKRGICITISEQIYIWGYVSQKQVLFTPKLVKKQSNYSKQQIRSACCSYNGFYIMTGKGQVFNVISGTLMKRLFKQNQSYDEKILISVGNNMLQIMYGVGLKISCYDTVKKKQLIRWFKKMYEIQDSSQGQLLVNQDINSQWETKKSIY